MIEARPLSEFAARVEAQVFNHILPFWSGTALDHEYGGWLPWLSNRLQVDRSQPKGLILNTRILWAFSAAYRARPKWRFEEMARRAFDTVNRFWDPDYGGAYWRLGSDGQVWDDSRKIYGQAFYIYALTEYYLAFDDSAALERAKALFNLLEQHAHDPEARGYWEVRQCDWSEAADSRLSEKDLNEKKSMNNHLHLLEACANLYRVWKDPQVELRLRELLDLFLERILNPKTHHLDHFFDENWKVRSDTYTFGHDIEASWLLCEAAEVLGDAQKAAPVREAALRMAEIVLADGLDADGGLCYEGKDGRIIDSRKECWPQAEAVVGFLNAFELSGKSRFLTAARQVWDYIEDHLVDQVHGEWFWRINADGKPDAELPKVSEWKGPYHGTRACLETLRRIKQFNV